MTTPVPLPATEQPPVAGPGRLPVGTRAARALVLAAVFICAACGLVYELALVALGSYLIGDAVVQASIVLSVMVFAMGVGSLAAKPLQRWPAQSFAAIECALGLLGGLSVLGLYAAFAWLDLYRPVLVTVAFVIGALIGAEIPLLMTLIQRIRRQDAGSAVADLFAADYVGALVGGLTFPFALLPWLGQVRGALAVGMLNAFVGIAVVLWLFRREVARGVRLMLWGAMVAVCAVLALAFVLAGQFEVSARQALFDDPVVMSQRSPYQEIVVTQSQPLRGAPDLRLFLDGDLQFSSVDEYRYHEALVHPAMAGRHRSVLVLGGGDGLALREILGYQDVRRVVLVDLDPAMTRLGRSDPRFRSLNHRSFDDPRVQVVNADAFSWLRSQREVFDAVIVDLPDPDTSATAKLYAVEFYGLVRRTLAPGGRAVVQAGSPYFAPRSFWCIEASVRTAGLATAPYHVDVPSFGDWGFILAAPGGGVLTMPTDPPSTRFIDAEVLRAATVFSKDRRRIPVRPSTLDRPVILEYERAEWRDY
jgi:spermidine synthase